MKFSQSIAGLFLAIFLSIQGVATAGTGISWGGDLRVRLVNEEQIPIAAGYAVMGQNQYHRTRTRIWGAYGFTPDIALKVRLTNEFYDNTAGKPDGAPSVSKRFPSEVVADNIYVDINNLLAGKLDLRIGRQDLFYGNGKIILDGTPEDGSRTSYFNGIKAQYSLSEDLTVDFIAVANNDEDWLAINNQHRNLSPNDIDESGVGFYLKNNHKKYPSELYYIFKHENDVSATDSDVDLHTMGARIMPKFNQSLSGNLEIAYQTGNMTNNTVTDLEGWLVDAKLAYRLPLASGYKPVIDLSYYYLSGDDPNSSTSYEGWWQVFGRWSQSREIAVYGSIGVNASPRNSPGWWTNLSTPSLGLNMAITEKGKFDVRGAWLMVDEDNGAGTGKNRGLYLTSKFRYNFTEKISGQLIYEFLDPGNYYLDSAKNAHFSQAQMVVNF